MAHDATAPTPARSAVAMADDTTTKRSAVTVALLVLACCRLALSFPMLSPPSSSLAREDDHDDDPAARRVEPVGYLASVASSVLAAYVAASVMRRDGRPRLSAGALLAEARRTWGRPAATALYVELLTSAMASLLLTLGAFLAAIVDVGGGGSAAAGLLAASGSVALVGWLGPVLFAHSDIACRVSLVVAAVEDGRAGAAAVRRAEVLVAGRRARGVAVGLVAGAIEQAPAWLCGDGAPVLVLAPAVLAAKVAACCACAAFYYDCRRRHDVVSSGLKLEGVTKSCQMDGFDMGDESEIEVEKFGSAFECFRLT